MDTDVAERDGDSRPETVDESVRPARPPGRLLRAVTLLLALAALAIGALVYYQVVYLKPMDALALRLAALESAVPKLQTELAAARADQQRGMDDLAVRQREDLEQARQTIIAALNEATDQAPPSPREWKLAEVEYLLRIANNRILMERDVDGALNLLTAADAILLELDDFALYPVRAQLADEILALESVTGTDVQGIYLRLEAIKENLGSLPLDVPEYIDDPMDDQQPAEDLGFLEALMRKLSGYLEFRRFDTRAKPLLAPEEGVYLELNLRLMLERAQLATLRRQQVVYEQSLATARQWLVDYLNVDDPAVEQAVTEIDALLVIRLNQSMPDISGSLDALRRARRGAS